MGITSSVGEKEDVLEKIREELRPLLKQAKKAGKKLYEIESLTLERKATKYGVPPEIVFNITEGLWDKIS